MRYFAIEGSNPPIPALCATLPMGEQLEALIGEAAISPPAALQMVLEDDH